MKTHLTITDPKLRSIAAEANMGLRELLRNENLGDFGFLYLPVHSNAYIGIDLKNRKLVYVEYRDSVDSVPHIIRLNS